MQGTSKMQYPTRLRGAELTHTEHHVLILLWTYSDAQMENAWPSVERLAKDARTTGRTVQRALGALREKGYVEIVKAGGWTEEGNRANTYRLTLPQHGVTPLSPQGCQERQGGGDADVALSDPSSDPSSDPPIAVPVPETPVPSLRSPSPSGRRADQETRDRLLPLIREVARAEAWDDYDKAAEAFLDALEDEGIEDPGFWDYGWSEKLDGHIRRHGVDYGSAKWLGIYLNAARAA